MNDDQLREIFFQRHPDPMWIYDRESLRFLEVNEAAIRRYGYTRNEFLSMTIADIRPSRDVPAVEQNVAEVSDGLDQAGVWRHRLKSGEIVSVEITSHALAYAGKPAEMVLARRAADDPVGHARAVREAILEESIGLRTAQGLLGLGLWTMDLETGRLSWSDEVYGVYGLPEDSFPENFDGYVDLVHPADRQAMQENYAAFEASQGSEFYFEHRVLTAEGEVRHVQGAAQINTDAGGRRLVGVAQDVTRQRQAERALRESERQLRMAGRIARLGAWRILLDREPPEVLWSDETAAIHGEPAGFSPSVDEAIEYYVPEHRQRIRQLFEACVRDGEGYDEVLQIRTSGGERAWVRTIAVAEREPEGQIVAVRGAFQDVSDLIAAREEARTSDQRLRKTLESISDAFFTLDTEWRFEFLNSRAERLLGRSRDDLLGRSLWEEFPPSARGSTFEDQLHRAVEERRTVEFVDYAALFDAWLDVTAYPTRDGLAVYFRDVTEERAQSEQLRLLEAAVNQQNDALLITTAEPLDEPDGPRIVYVNRAFEQATGYSREEALGRTPRFLQGPKTERAQLDRIRRALESSSPVQVELINYTSEGREFLVELDIVPVVAEDDQVTHFVAVQRDVTERRELEARLRQAQKLEAVGQLTGGLAHDFNNLLSIVLGNAEILLEELHRGSPVRDCARATLEAAQRGARLTQSLLAFSRRQALRPEVVDAGKLVAGMDHLLRRTLPEEIEIEIVRAGGLWSTEIDPSQLESAVLNLAINARDAMPSGGRLTIETANTRLDEEYGRDHEIRPGQYVLVSVTDTGSGMTTEEVARAFEPFFTTKSAGLGSGLGLSMVYGFVKQSGGHVKLYSERGEGTALKMYFPRSVSAATSADPELTPEEDPKGDEHILVVEDDEQVRRHIRGLLERMGYEVSTAASGPEALEILDRHSDVDLLFTDVVMPGGMNGRELADVAKRLHPRLGILFTSGYTENAIVHQGRLDPGVELLTKPYPRRELASKIRRILDQRDDPPAS